MFHVEHHLKKAVLIAKSTEYQSCNNKKNTLLIMYLLSATDKVRLNSKIKIIAFKEAGRAYSYAKKFVIRTY